MLDAETGVHDHDQARGPRFLGGLGVFDTLLHPDDFSADGDGTGYDGWDVFTAAEDVDDFNVCGGDSGGGGFQGGLGFFAQDFGFVGIYRDDAVAGGLNIFGDVVAGALGI